MRLLRITQKLQKELGIKAADIEPDKIPAGVFQEWYAHVFILDRKKQVIFVETQTLFSFCVSNLSRKDIRERFAEISFDFSTCGKQITVIKDLVGYSGYLFVYQMTVEALEVENHIVFLGYKDSGDRLTEDQCFRLFSVPGDIVNENISINVNDRWQNEFEVEKNEIIQDIEERNSSFFDDEITKLDKWADDLKNGLETEIKILDREIKQLKRGAKKIPVLNEKLKAQRHIKDLEKKRKEKRARLFEEQDTVEECKEKLIETIETQLKQKLSVDELFRIKWRVV